MSFEDLREDRLKKLELLKQAGMDPYPAVSHRDTSVADALLYFSDLAAHADTYTIAGRVTSVRLHGGVAFADITDGTTAATIQIVVKKDEVGDVSFDLFASTIDRGDFVEFAGTLFVTNRGQNSLAAKSWRMLTKSIRPLPDSWSGFADPEERLRKRYLDILMNKEVREIVEKRSLFWRTMRDFLLARGFLEVETPVIETTPGGADARPFVSHHNALDIPVTMRISAGELWQKRLMVAGLPKTFEIGRIFRNEGMSAEHLQDYTQMEFYWAYANFKDGMALVAEMYKAIAEAVFGTLQFSIHGHEVDLGKAWVEIDYKETIEKETGISIEKASTEEIVAKLRELKVEYDAKGLNKMRATDALWKHCRKQIAGPAFLTGVSVEMEPLAKRSQKDINVVDRFQVIIAGSEVGKGFSELNDPEDQAERFREQQALKDAGDEEAQSYDADYVEALEYGMPPTCGFGVSERLFAFLANLPVREAQIFPLMRPKGEQVSSE